MDPSASPGPSSVRPVRPARPVLIWAVAVLAYLAAVFHRTSLGVAAVIAGQRFGVGAGLLALFSVAQLAVYAAMQIPVGVLLDRFGPRRLILAGAGLMAGGQLLFALAGDIRLAIAARMLIGLGDAMTFISVLRVGAAWFPAERTAILNQLTGMLGQLGSLASAFPLVALLHRAGWTPTYLLAAGLGTLVVVLVVGVLRDAPVPPGEAVPVGRRSGLRAAWAEPGTRLAAWTHFVSPFSGNVFALLWGYPFLVEGEGLSPAGAAGLLSLLTVVMLASGLVIGRLSGRWPYRRSSLVLVIVAASATVWTAVLLWPGRAPSWLLVLLVVVLASNGPGSLIGFDHARVFNPRHRLGSASGIVNMGGFVSAIALIGGVGLVLDLLTPTGAAHPPLSAFRWAFAVQYLIWGLGAAQVLWYRRAARHQLARYRPETLAALRRGQAVGYAEV